jgi:hypothetical protein
LYRWKAVEGYGGNAGRVSTCRQKIDSIANFKIERQFVRVTAIENISAVAGRACKYCRAAGASVTRRAETIMDPFVQRLVQPVAEISEDSTTLVDTRMEALGGTVFRRALKEVKRTFHDDDVAAMKADRTQLKAEHAKADAERKVKLEEKINQLDSKIQARLERSKQRRQAAEAREEAKAEFLQARAAVMKANAPKKHVGPPE